MNATAQPPHNNRPDNQPDWLEEIFNDKHYNYCPRGNSCTCWVKEAKAAITTKIAEERIDELTNFNLPQYDHSKCIDKRSCIGYENAQSDFDNEKALRIAELEAALKGDK